MARTKTTPKPTDIVRTPPVAEIVPTAATRTLTPAIWKMIETLAPTMHAAHLFGVTSVAQAAAIILKGYELGLSTTASFEFVQVIQGKPALSPRGAMAILLSSPLVKEIKIEKLSKDVTKGTFLGYSCTMERVSGFKYTAQFTLEDAARAGLIKPDSGWAKYPENMCLWRAVGFAADVVFPDVTAGMTTLMKMPEEYGVSLSQDGNIIDAAPVSVPSVTPLNELLSQYSAEEIMAANDGKIPTNDNEIAAIREKLEKNVKTN